MLKLRLSDYKYKSVMATIDLVLGSLRSEADSLKFDETTDDTKKLNHEHIKFDDFENTESYFHDTTSDIFENKQNTSEKLTIDQLHKRVITTADFEVGEVAVSLLKFTPNNNTETTLAALSISAFRLSFTQRTFDIGVKISIVDIKIRDLLRTDEHYEYLLEAVPAAPHNMVCKIEYMKYDKHSPEFNGFLQTLDISTQSADVVLCRSSILALYDFILSIFTAPNVDYSTTFMITPKIEEKSIQKLDEPQSLLINSTINKICFMIDDGTLLATLEFVSVNFALRMQNNTIKIEGSLGDMSLTDNTALSPAFKSLLHIEGSQVANFMFETFDHDGDYKGYDAQFTLRAASMRLAYVEVAILRLQAYLIEFSKMHLLLNSARNAAVKSAALVQQSAGKTKFDVVIQTPIVDIPRPGSNDFVTVYLGELKARNEIAVDDQCRDMKVVRINEIRAELSDIRIETCLHTRTGTKVNQCIPEINVNLSSITRTFEDWSTLTDSNLKLGDITCSLTDCQYALVAEILNLGDQRNYPQSQSQQSSLSSQSKTTLKPKSNTDKSNFTIEIPNIILELLTEDPSLYNFSDTTDNPTDAVAHLARFSIQRAHLNRFVDETGACKLEIQVGEFGLLDTRPAVINRFRDAFVPGVSDGKRNMLQVHFSSFAGRSDVVVTFEMSRVYLVLDYIHDLQEFAMQPFRNIVDRNGAKKASMTGKESEDMVDEQQAGPQLPDEEVDNGVGQSNAFSYSVNLVDLEVVVLQDASSLQSEAIILAIHQLAVAYDTVMTVEVHKVGVFFCIMGDEERLQFIEDFDITMKIDQQLVGPGHIISNVVVDCSEIMVYFSYHDTELLLDIVNQASVLLTAPVMDQSDEIELYKKVDKIVMIREKLLFTSKGLRMILIDDFMDSNLPMLDLHIDSFETEVSDWSNTVRVT
ncbi:hypothetical protein HK096_003160 [Nowakowskiella sp. JEL0078]|nr:hypothetical protein HK096_003160 [Nowakowskiella sp. JEL0078]